jgi:hypothetical protein
MIKTSKAERNALAQARMSKKAARKVGKMTYYGRACRKGHTQRYTSNSHCVECKKTASTKSRVENHEYKNALDRKWYSENQEYKSAMNRKWRAENLEYARARSRRWYVANREYVLARKRQRRAEQRAWSNEY